MNATQKVIDTRISSIEAKLRTLKGLSNKMPFSIGFSSTDSAVYQLQGYSSAVSKVYYNDIGFEMRANSSNGVVFYMLSEPGKMVC